MRAGQPGRGSVPGGSRGRGDSDAYSDVDLCVIAKEPYEKLDRTIDPAVLSPIAETFVPMERDALLRAARELVRCYTARAPGIAHANEATYPLELEELMVKRLDDLADSR